MFARCQHHSGCLSSLVASRLTRNDGLTDGDRKTAAGDDIISAATMHRAFNQSIKAERSLNSGATWNSHCIRSVYRQLQSRPASMLVRGPQPSTAVHR